VVGRLFPLSLEEKAELWVKPTLLFGYRFFEHQQYGGRDGGYTYTTDRHGFVRNDSDPGNKQEVGPKPEGEVRIFVVGGSTVAGYTTPPEHSIPAQLERILNRPDRRPLVRYRVINAGVPAWVSRQEYLFSVLVLGRLEPDVIVALDGYNDFSVSASWGYGIEPGWSKERFVSSGELDTGLHRLLLRWECEQRHLWAIPLLSAFFEECSRLYTMRFAQGILKRWSGTKRWVPPTGDDDQPDVPYGRPLPGPHWIRYVPEAVEYYEENLNALAQFCRSRGMICLVALQPNLAVDGKPLTDEERSYLREMERKHNGVLRKEAAKWWGAASEEFERLSKRCATDEKLQFVNMKDVFLDHNGCMYLSDTVHYTEDGNRVIADVLARWILEQECP
jgi:lysophospholipase L1-like esterase